MEEEMDSLIRLVDALAGASARLEKYQEDKLSELFSLAQENGTLIEV